MEQRFGVDVVRRELEGSGESYENPGAGSGSSLGLEDGGAYMDGRRKNPKNEYLRDVVRDWRVLAGVKGTQSGEPERSGEKLQV